MWLHIKLVMVSQRARKGLRRRDSGSRIRRRATLVWQGLASFLGVLNFARHLHVNRKKERKKERKRETKKRRKKKKADTKGGSARSIHTMTTHYAAYPLFSITSVSPIYYVHKAISRTFTCGGVDPSSLYKMLPSAMSHSRQMVN